MREKGNKDEHAVVDIIARAEDASKIQRIMDRFELACVDRASIVTQAEKDIAERKQSSQPKDNSEKEKSEKDDFYNDIFADDEAEPANAENESAQKVDETEVEETENPFSKRTESPLSEKNSTDTPPLSDKGTVDKDKKPSVKEKLNELKKEFSKQKSDKSKTLDVGKNEHHTPKIKNPKER